MRWEAFTVWAFMAMERIPKSKITLHEIAVGKQEIILAIMTFENFDDPLSRSYIEGGLAGSVSMPKAC